MYSLDLVAAEAVADPQRSANDIGLLYFQFVNAHPLADGQLVERCRGIAVAALRCTPQPVPASPGVKRALVTSPAR